MATLLFRLANVSEEEAWEVRRLFDQHGFDTYETHAGFWRLGVDAIWLRDASQLEAAREVLDRYQAERQARVQQEHADQLKHGQAPTLWHRLRQQPIQVLLVGLAVVAILALTLVPFLGLI
ncbi:MULTISPECIES: DUF6164 family protein [Halomonas]|uniref:DUF2007 domain-containing protein n=1 Tax=Halomonas chromatireducens TaxID=507626 RepID=A0A0X8HDN7_9GAMM|nr:MULTISPECIES: DUF6164 family protein [Halomonas]AMD00738.1 hypothetical protein LOKO_01670 [Halomonas chromatireducens]MBZ0330944.1 hypothetical protein [Halomonas sp. ANAO-440]